MGPIVRDRHGRRYILTRMGFLFCIDGFPAFNQKRRGAISLCPGELINLSLPPHMRYDPDNIMIWILIPNEMSAANQLKYFKYLTITELNPLQSEGLRGPDGPVKLKLFGASLDLKGKEKFYNTSTVQSYCGCSTCEVHYDQGPGGPIFACARRFLPAGHPLRARGHCRFKGQLYEYGTDEARTAPAIKTTRTLMNYVALKKHHGVEHFLGQKGHMMLCALAGIQYDKFNILEWLHNMARTFDNFMDLLVGGSKSYDRKGRVTSKVHGVFQPIWPDTIVYLSQVNNLTVRNVDRWEF